MKTRPTVLSLSPLTTQRIVLTRLAQCPSVQENNLPVIAVLIIFIIICLVRPRYAGVAGQSRSNDISPVVSIGGRAQIADAISQAG
jgi:hypothetical protein